MQLLLWAIVPLIIIVVLVSVLGIVTHQSSMRDLVARRDAQLATVAADLLDERLLLHIRLLETVAEQAGSLPELREFDGGLLLLNEAGNVLASTRDDADRTSPPDWVTAFAGKMAETGLAHVSDPFIDPASGHRSLLFAVPYAEGGVLVGQASFSHLGLPTMIDSLTTGQRGVTSLVDGKGVTIYHPDPAQEGLDTSDREGIDALKRGERGASFHREPDGEEMVMGFSPSRYSDWGLVILEPWADAVAPLMRVSQMTPIILVLTTVAALLVIYFGMRYIIRPLQDLEREATRVAWGDFDATQGRVGGVQEIETLRQTLNQMTSQIREYQVALRDYLAAVTRAEEDERRRVARELHDDTVQNLIALVHRVEMCEKVADDPDRLARRLDETRSLATQALESTRRLIHNLRPAYLEDLGLVAAVEALARDMEIDHARVSIRLSVIGIAQRLDRDVELAAFRIVQEALSNAVRHSRANVAQITLAFTDGDVTITVNDDGIGFSAPQAPHEMAQEGHFGLMGIHERVLRLGGHLSVQSTPGGGTSLVAVLPYCCPPPAPTPD